MKKSKFWTTSLCCLLKTFIVVFQSLNHVSTLQPHGNAAHQAKLSPGVCSNSCQLSWWCHPTISSSVTHFSSCPQYFQASGSFPMTPHFASNAQSIAASASASVLPIFIQGWFLWDWMVWLPSYPGDSPRVFSSTTIQKRQFFSTQPSLWSSFHIHTWLLEKP